MSVHSWCSDPARDEAVRAAEDGRQGPLPTLEQCIETARAMMPKSVSATSAPEPENKANGMRTERVTLEVTHDCAYPAAEWVLEVVQEACSDPGESVRVVEVVRLPPTIIRLTDEREAARRERDEARADLATMRGKCDGLKDRVAELEAAPAANAGGEAKQQPVAWGVRIDSGRGLYGHYDFESEARGVCDAVNAEEGWAMTVVPLYAAPVAKSATTPQPPRGWLTDGERRAIEEGAYALVHEGYYGARAKSELLLALLSRSSPPRVKVPGFVAVEDWHTRDRKWIAAIREAGGEVE